MPRGRVILKSISESKKLSMLKTDGARLLYSWTLPHLDINGCFSGDSEVINHVIFPRLKKTSEEVEEFLKDLEKNNLIVRYEANNDVFLHYPDFVEKQPYLNPGREAEPTIPKPTHEQLMSNSRVTQAQSKSKRESKSKYKSKCKSISPEKQGFLDVDIKLNQFLIDLILKNDPKSKVKNLTVKQQADWINQCRLLREKDGRTPEEIYKVIKFSQEDNFWKGNILSMPTLREKFSQLWLKAKNTKLSGIEEWVEEVEKDPF